MFLSLDSEPKKIPSKNSPAAWRKEGLSDRCTMSCCMISQSYLFCIVLYYIILCYRTLLFDSYHNIVYLFIILLYNVI